MVERKQRAPTLYVIILVKLLKGSILLLLAFGAYSLADKNLPEIFKDAIRWIHFDPEKEFFSDLGEKLEKVTPENVRWVAMGTLLYSCFSLVEGVGLIFRVSWAGWLAIGESAFFIPIEVYDLMHEFSVVVGVILVLNIVIVWYLLQNRKRLFHHHHHGNLRG